MQWIDWAFGSGKTTTAFELCRRIEKESFAVGAIDRCIHSFDNHIKNIKIMTDSKSVDDIVAEIAKKAALILPKTVARK